MMRSVKYAVRALKQELFGFRLTYPVEVIEKAGAADDLHYYLWNPTLFLDNLVFDEEEVPRKRYRAQGLQYNLPRAGYPGHLWPELPCRKYPDRRRRNSWLPAFREVHR